ncbi:MAG: GDP-mannose 4,6-dehydratase [Acidobacteria bacterium]|nr:GDP-mannose 4,6-dehydratase [Acidobacteriota bacterium]MCA1640390.1 GDP-mannose 4,6-dehydratase [Acidobacteriota bacterium]
MTERLLAEGWEVHATTRRPASLDALAHSSGGRLKIHAVELTEPAPLFDLVGRVRPAEVYNLAGQSSVSRSFSEPLRTWATNADFIAGMLEAMRLQSPLTRFYQASSTDMFGASGAGVIRYDESSALNPQSPYASAKAAAHLLCRSYREAYDLRVACGILSNHESRRRPTPFLSRKIVDHVRALRGLPGAGRSAQPPLLMGNLKIRRDWGFAPDYVAGMQLIIRQTSVRAAAPGGEGFENRGDAGALYRDYVLGTGRSHAVWELVDEAFRIAGFGLAWRLEGDDPREWSARFSEGGGLAVAVDASLLRPADPLVIEVDSSRARAELGWSPRRGLEVFLRDMLEDCA